LWAERQSRRRHEPSVLREHTQTNGVAPAASDPSTRSAPTATGAADSASRQSQSAGSGEQGASAAARRQPGPYSAS